jgi:hypothetical protein
MGKQYKYPRVLWDVNRKLAGMTLNVCRFVGKRTSRLSRYGDAQGANSDRDFQPVLGIAIEEQKPGSGIKGKGFPQLLDDPQARGVFGDVEVQNASAIVADHEEAIECAERDYVIDSKAGQSFGERRDSFNGFPH